jgi:putative dimethyl sulfoxide reductase chaperone
MGMEKIKNNHNVLKGYNMLLYFAGSMIMNEPTEECVKDFWKNGILKHLPVISVNPRFVKAASQLRDSCEDQSLCTQTLHDDYNRLFISGGLPLAPLYESDYNFSGSGLSVLKRDTVSAFYDSYGWASKFRYKTSDDHLGVELLFLTFLIEKYLELEDDFCKIEMGNEILRFIDQHIMTWIPLWNEHIQDQALTLCYKGIGTLIYSSLEDIKSVLSYSGKPL